MTRLNQILAGLLVVQLGLAALVFLGDEDETIRALRPVVADLDPEAVDRVQVFDRTAGSGDGEDATDENEAADGAAAEQASIVLERRGSEWVLVSHHDHPVDTRRVTELVDKVIALRSRGPVASGAARQRQLEVADDHYQRKLVIGAGDREVTLYVGASAGARQTSVRLAGQDEVHGVSGLTAFGVSADVSSWIDPSYLQIARDEIASVEVVNRNGTFTLVKDGDTWRALVDGQAVEPARGRELNTDTVDTVVGKAALVTMLEPGDPARSMDDPLATVTVRTRPPGAADGAGGAGADGAGADPAASTGPVDGALSTPAPGGEEIVLDIVKTDAPDRYQARVRGRAHAALVAALSVTELIELDRGDLTRAIGDKPEAPEPPPLPEGFDPSMLEGLPPGAIPGQP